MNIRFVQFACGGLLVAGATSFAQARSAPASVTTSAPTSAANLLAPQDAEPPIAADREVVITMRGGNVQVFINGEQIPQERIRREPGRVIILDEEGNEIDDIRIGGADEGAARAGAEAERRAGARGGIRAQLELERGARGRALLERIRERQDRMGAGGNAEESSAPASRVMLGVVMMQPHPALLHHLDIEEGKVTMVGGTHAGLPADEAGLEQYDIITEVNGSSPADPESIRAALREMNPDDELELTIIQGGDEKTITITLAAFDAERMQNAEIEGAMPSQDVFVPFGQGEMFGEGDYHIYIPPDGRQELFRRAPEMQWDWQAPRADDLPNIEGVPMPGSGNFEQRMEEMNARLDRLEELLGRVARNLETEPPTENLE